MKNTLLAALSLDGAWISDRLTARELSLFLRLAGRGPVDTDLPRWKTKPIPGLCHGPRRKLEERIGKEPLRVLATPELNAAVLQAGEPVRLYVWWRAKIDGRAPRRTLVPIGTPLRRFRLHSVRFLGGEPVGVYER